MLLTTAGIIVFLVQMGYWLSLHRGFRQACAASVEAGRGDSAVPPSVVVAGRDEKPHVGALMDALRNQSLPPSDVVFVDDGSTDGTADAAAAAAGRLPLRILRTGSAAGDKKAALSAGIRSAESPVVALTDADCVPAPGWLYHIARAHSSDPAEAVLVVGYSPFRRTHGLLNRLARYETFLTGYLTAAAIGLDRPYMAVGRNFSYSKALFNEVDGFERVRMVRSGDDDLFLQHATRSGSRRVVPLLHPASFVTTDAPPGWRAWIRQKRRHVSASHHYSLEAKLHLTLLQASSTAMWLLPFVLGWIGVALLTARLVVQHLLLRRAAARMGEGDLMPIHPVLDFLYALYNLILVPVALAKAPRGW